MSPFTYMTATMQAEWIGVVVVLTVLGASTIITGLLSLFTLRNTDEYTPVEQTPLGRY